MFNKTFKLSSLALATSLLVACGGGGGGDNSSTPPPQNSKSFSGVAVDFYLAEATVQLDDCNNYKIENATDGDGKFTFTLPAGCTESAITITGGVDTVTGKDFTGTLKVKSRNLENINNAVASPLTTLEAVLPENDFKEVLKNLGFLENTDVSSFNPVTQGSAEQLATVFLVQQLLTQIEDAIQKSGASADAATSIAAQALGKVLKDNPIVVNGSYDTNLFESIVAEAEDLVPFAIDTASIASNLTTISNAIKDVGLSGNGSALVDALKEEANKSFLDNIKESIPTPPAPPQIPTEFTKLEIGGYSLEEFKNSSLAAPIELEKNEFSKILNVNLLLAAPQVNTPETATIGLKISAGNETLDLVLKSVNIYFDGLGRPVKAILPKNSTIKVESTVQALGRYKNLTINPNQDIELTVNNGVIELGSFVSEEEKLESAFNSYYSQVVSAGSAKAVTFVKLDKYAASPSLNVTATGSGDVLGISFTNAYNVEGYFKFNRVTVTP